MNKTWWQCNCPNSIARSENPKKLLLVSLRTWTLGAVSHHVRTMVLCSHHMERPQGETIQRRDSALATVSPAILVFPNQVPVTDKATLRWADPSLDTTWVQFHKRSWIAWLSPVNLQALRKIKIKWFCFQVRKSWEWFIKQQQIIRMPYKTQISITSIGIPFLITLLARQNTSIAFLTSSMKSVCRSQAHTPSRAAT